MAMTDKALDDRRIEEKLRGLEGWVRQKEEIVKVYSFKDYYQTMAFVNAIAWISHRENHHPDLEVGYNRCVVHYSTHSAGGLTDKDFHCAAKIEKMVGL
ncbi:MAG: 4a-hydroxytetrahydrobiopterin dehydratase [Phycisphaerales bacterium]|jgi:4a-hydroxytetrahydrobiopterin dehydratase|nr:4a-hydroxytetrahydrobiopterin dehydratase [Phycisphaerales bacterium]